MRRLELARAMEECASRMLARSNALYAERLRGVFGTRRTAIQREGCDTYELLSAWHARCRQRVEALETLDEAAR